MKGLFQSCRTECRSTGGRAERVKDLSEQKIKKIRKNHWRKIYIYIYIYIYIHSPGNVLWNGPLDVDGHSFPQTSINGPQIGNSLYGAQRIYIHHRRTPHISTSGFHCFLALDTGVELSIYDAVLLFIVSLIKSHNSTKVMKQWISTTSNDDLLAL